MAPHDRSPDRGDPIALSAVGGGRYTPTRREALMHGIAHSAPLPLCSTEPWLHRVRESVPGVTSRLVAGGAVIAPVGGTDATFVVESGAVLVWATVGARPAVVAALGAGDVLGPEAPSAHSMLRSEARALVPSRVLRLPAAGLGEACRRDGQLANDLADARVAGAERVEWRLAVALTMPVRGRVAEALRELARVGGRPTPAGMRIELPVTQELLSFMTGSTRESVNRALQKLTADGSVRRAGRTLIIPVTRRPVIAPLPPASRLSTSLSASNLHPTQ